MTSLPTLAIPAKSPNRVVNRPIADFPPNIWGDHFLVYRPEERPMQTSSENLEKVQRLKEQVRRMLTAPFDKPLEKLELIDAIQRLGVAYHFECEIDGLLQQMYDSNYGSEDDQLEHHDKDDLRTIALRFRLLRQQGYKIPSDVLVKFKDSEGKFKESLIHDVEGMLQLYEASHMRVHGEDILEEALSFTTSHLESAVTNLSPPLAARVSHAIRWPLRKCLPRIEARHYLSTYQENALYDEVLLKFAKFDFNILQELHQKELSLISKWWKDLDFTTQLSFARDRVVEVYFWILGVYFEPQYSNARVILTKICLMVSILDDMFDAYGTFEELEVFTDALQRWDINCIDQLPEYMKYLYRTLWNIYKELEEEMSKEGKLYRVYYAKQALINRHVQALFAEAKWFNENHMPTMEEYMSVAEITVGYFAATTTSFVGMGDIVTKEAFDWVFNFPKVLRAATTIFRLTDDLVTNEFEQKRGHVVSAVQCYMKQHGVSRQQADEELQKQIMDAWKEINQECLNPMQVPMPLLMNILNFARVVEVFYKDGLDGYTRPGKVLTEFVTSLLVNPVPT